MILTAERRVLFVRGMHTDNKMKDKINVMAK